MGIKHIEWKRILHFFSTFVILYQLGWVQWDSEGCCITCTLSRDVSNRSIILSYVSVWLTITNCMFLIALCNSLLIRSACLLTVRWGFSFLFLSLPFTFRLTPGPHHSICIKLLRTSPHQQPLMTFSSWHLHVCPEEYNLSSGLLLILHAQKLSLQALQPETALRNRLHQIWVSAVHGKDEFLT